MFSIQMRSEIMHCQCQQDGFERYYYNINVVLDYETNHFLFPTKFIFSFQLWFSLTIANMALIKLFFIITTTTSPGGLNGT